jgi:hypothetical protein
VLSTSVKYELSKWSHSGVQLLPPGLPGPSFVYLVACRVVYQQIMYHHISTCPCCIERAGLHSMCASLIGPAHAASCRTGNCRRWAIDEGRTSLPKPERLGLARPSVCAPDSATMSLSCSGAAAASAFHVAGNVPQWTPSTQRDMDTWSPPVLATHAQAHAVEHMAQVLRCAGGLVGPALLRVALASCARQSGHALRHGTM